MEPILVYGYPAGSSMGLVAALEWLGRPYRLCRVDMLGQMREPPYARLNARIETPVLITDDGLVVTETMAIAAWLEARDVKRRISFDPRDPRTDRMHQFLGFVNTGFTGAFSPLWTAMETKTDDAAFLDALRRYGQESVLERHDKLEAMLGDTPFLMGADPTLADAVLIGVARWLDVHQVPDADRWPKLAALRRRLEADPAVLFATALETDPKGASGSPAFLGHVSLDEVIERYAHKPQ